MNLDQPTPANGNSPGGLTPQPNAAAGVTASVDTSLSESWLVVRKRKWIILSAALLGSIIGVLMALSTPKLYQASGDIQVNPGAADQYRVETTSNALAGGDDISTRLETEVAILQSDTLALEVIRQLKLQENPFFNAGAGPMNSPDMTDPGTMRAMLKHFHDGLMVKRVPKTELISIDFTSRDPRLSARVVNTLINDYIERSFQVRFASTQKVSGWLSHQLDDLRDEVERNQEEMVNLQKKLGVVGLDAAHNLITAQLEDLTKAVTDSRVELFMNEARYRILSDTNPDLYESESGPSSMGMQGGSQLLSSLRAQKAQFETTLAQLTTQYGPNWPGVRSLKNQIAQNEVDIATEQKRILAQSEVAYSAAKANEQMASAALNTKEAEAYRSRDDVVEYAILERKFESSRDLYEGLTKRLREADIQAGLQTAEIDIVDSALIPSIPTGPRRLEIVLLGAMFGIIGGVALAFLLESLDTSLRSIAEIESTIELPSLAVIPRAKRSQFRSGELVPAHMRNIDVLAQPKSQFSESFRSLRTSLLLSTVGRPPGVILITSSIPSEGKTTVACNIAAALSQRDVKVLLIDADLRRPTVHHRFGLSAKVGMTTVLANTTSFEESIQRIPELPNLDILASGPVPPFPTEMIGSERMAQILQEARQHYSHIVMDSPPILSVTDGVILARLADAVALVMRHGGASKHIVRRARDLLLRAGSPLTGLILNAVDLSSPDYYGYYGYYRYSYLNTDGEGGEPSQRRSANGAGPNGAGPGTDKGNI